MNEIIEKLEFGLMVCASTGTNMVHISQEDVEKIIATLKEQEPVEPIKLENWWKCPSCSGNIVSNMKYCPRCGNELKWYEI